MDNQSIVPTFTACKLLGNKPVYQDKPLQMKLLYSIVFLLFSFLLNAQTAPEKWMLHLNDKVQTRYTVEKPGQFLSQKALLRRANQGIAIDQRDLPVSEQYIRELENQGLHVVYQSKWLNTVLVENRRGIEVSQVAALPFVKAVQPLSHFPKKPEQRWNKQFTKPFLKNESFYLQGGYSSKQHSGSQDLDYGGGWDQIHMLKGEELHKQGYQGQGMTIAVIDGGFWNADTISAFDSLWINNQVLGSKNFVNANESVFHSGISSHGMSVLSAMAANQPGQLIGTAPKADYWLLRSEDTNAEYLMEEYYWVQAAEFADSVGVDIINSSLGYTLFDDPAENHTYQDMDGNTTPITIGADIAAAKGILVVNSAGNSGDDPWLYIGAPADGDSVFSIGAVNAQGAYAPFSSQGPTADGRIKPDVTAIGQGTYVMTPYGYYPGNGTSFSSPVMAGITACLWQAHPTYSNIEVMEAIRKSGSQYNQPDGLLGYGIPNMLKAHGNLSAISEPVWGAGFRVRVSPNPFTSHFIIQIDAPEKAHLVFELYDRNGRQIMQKELVVITGNNEFSYNGLNVLPTGLYIFRFVDGNQAVSLKMLKK